MAFTLEGRCDAIEECYEFMLAYAGQGVSGDSGSPSGSQLRTLLGRAIEALSGLGAAYAAAVVVDRDAEDSLTAIELVMAQPAISSQLIDNLTASIHLRALLTDLFLMDEILKLQFAATQTKKAAD